MPYIPNEERLAQTPTTPGQLNFQITRLILDYLQWHGLTYRTLNDITGALEQAKDEFQRRVVHPYEDRKLAENGDVGYESWECPRCGEPRPY